MISFKETFVWTSHDLASHLVDCSLIDIVGIRLKWIISSPFTADINYVGLIIAKEMVDDAYCTCKFVHLL